MKRIPAHSKAQSDIPKAINHRLNCYTLAAGAAGVSLLALAQPADAEVVFTPTRVVIGFNGVMSYDLDLNGDGIVDFTIQAAHHCNTDQCFYFLYDKPPGGNGVVGTGRSQGQSPAADALNKGVTVGPGQQFFGQFVSMASFYFGGGGSSAGGNWANVSNRFLGLVFQINGEPHYGWARLTVRDEKLRITAVLTAYAYETVARQPLKAGQTSGTLDTSAPPRRSSLGALARGAAK
jgi:hypothetical protein